MAEHQATALELFRGAFERAWREARRRLIWRGVASGLVFGAGLGAISSGLAWYFSVPSALRTCGSACIVAACVTGSLLWTVRRLPSRERWAVIFDARARCGEQISAALGVLGHTSHSSHMRHVPHSGNAGALELWLAERALAALSQPDRAHLPARFVRWHWAVLGALPALLGSWLWLPVAESVRTVDTLTQSPQWQQLDELSESLTAPELDPLSEPERQRLRELALMLQELTKRQRDGELPPTWRKDLSRLHDTLNAAREDFESAHEREAIDAAVVVLRSNPGLARAALALSAREALRFDAELRKFSGAEERAARQRAQQTLARAEQAARSKGASHLARALSEQSLLLALRGQAGERIKELITQLGPPASETNPSASSQSAPRSNPDPPVQDPKLEAREQGSPERPVELHSLERRRLAERLQSGLQSGRFDFKPPAEASLEPALSNLGKDATQRLTRALEEFSAPADSARRLQALWEASRALAAVERATSGPATPLTDPQQFEPGAPNREPTDEQSGAPSPGVGGTARYERPAEAAQVATTVVGKTQQLELSQGLYHDSQGQSWSTLPPSPQQALPPVLPARGPEQLQGVARPNVPSEYREHVSRYFSLE